MKYDDVENTLPEFNTAELGLTPPVNPTWCSNQQSQCSTDFKSCQLQSLLADMNVDGHMLGTRLLVPTFPSNAVESWKRHRLWFHPCGATSHQALMSHAGCLEDNFAVISQKVPNYFPKLSKEWIKCSSTSSSLALHCLTSASWTSYCMVSNGAPKQSNITS